MSPALAFDFPVVLMRLMVLPFRPGQESLPTAPARVAARRRAAVASMRAASILASVACAVVLAGCGASQLVSYDLSAPRVVGVRANSLRGVLAVNLPHADAAVDSKRILIREGETRLAYLAGAQWANDLPGLLQARLIDSFENARQLRAVGRPGMSSDFSLSTEIRRFEIDVTTGQARVEIVARIFSDKTGRPLAARVFSASAPAPKTADGVAAQALDAALADVLRKLVVWTIAAV